MGEGYHRLDGLGMKERDEQIILLLGGGLRHKIIASRVGMTPSGIATRLQKLREQGKIPVTRGRNRDG
ncbi:hypothetical protein LCGC14_0854150 [marine sediment metagenome]|uniref:HTH asnC-type domain-containing protein n=1 Tax=marine sediment metagenome TaxID=412755 RepID=A0A0F9PUL8_9ZZZZ